jgi:hypothetical protein
LHHCQGEPRHESQDHLTADQVAAMQPLCDELGYTAEEICQHAVAHYSRTMLPRRTRLLRSTTTA